MGSEAEPFAVATSHRVVSWRNGVTIWLIVALATWFQAERGMVSLAPLLLCTVLFAADVVYSTLARESAKVIDVTFDDENIVLHLDGSFRSTASDAHILDDLIEGPQNRRSKVGSGRRTLSIEHPGSSAVLAIEFGLVVTGLGLVRSTRRRTVLASPPVQRASEANFENGVRLPVDDSLRAYQFGDSMRRVHWPTTARTGSLRVRAADYTANAPTVVVVERQPSSDRESWNETVERTASLVGAALSSDRVVHLACRTIDASPDGTLYSSIRQNGIEAALGELGDFELMSEVSSRQVTNVGQVRAALAAVVPGPVDVIDEHEVRIS